MTGKNVAEEQVVVFQLNEQVYGIDIHAVREIIRMEKITQIPRSPEFMEGVISLRGGIIPVIDLHKRFGLVAKEQTEQSRIVIIQVNEVIFGIIVDAVQEVLRIPTDGIEPPPTVIGGVDGSFLRGIALMAERLIILMDHNNILVATEKEQLQDVNGGYNQ